MQTRTIYTKVLGRLNRHTFHNLYLHSQLRFDTVVLKLKGKYSRVPTFFCLLRQISLLPLSVGCSVENISGTCQNTASVLITGLSAGVSYAVHVSSLNPGGYSEAAYTFVETPMYGEQTLLKYLPRHAAIGCYQQLVQRRRCQIKFCGADRLSYIGRRSHPERCIVLPRMLVTSFYQQQMMKGGRGVGAFIHQSTMLAIVL
jgi:hypothetical protein